MDPITGEIAIENYKRNQAERDRDPREIFLIEQ
jgi:hypothetical protein